MTDSKSALDKIKEFVLNLGKEEVATVTPEEILTAPVVDLTEVVAEEVAVKLAEEEPIIEEEVEAEPEFVSMEEFNNLKALVESLQEKIGGEAEEMQKENLELKAELEEKPDAKKVVHAPKEVKVDLSTKENRLLNILRKNK